VSASDDPLFGETFGLGGAHARIARLRLGGTGKQ
jgi:hypothetical protein